MKKSAFTLLALTFATYAFSQTLDDGKKFLYYEKSKSAIQALEKVVASKPKDAESIYWLGQAYLLDYSLSHYANADDFNKAKQLYQQALQNGVNDPWIWVGSGQVMAYEGNLAGAKQQWEQAITASTTKGRKGGENADILNAVGRANAYGGSKYGDAQYGIDVLKRAAAIDTKNPDIDINLGICYEKLGNEHGGEAVQAFTDATVRDPKYAAGYFRIGLIYQSQDNKALMDEWYAKAIGADQAYGPVYFEYFSYYKDKDVNAAKDYLDSYIANSDQDCNTSYFQADYLFRAGKYQESLAKADSMANGDCKTFARINMLYAYDYDRLGDSVKSRSYLEKFFATATDPLPDDYVLAGKVYAKFPGYEDTASVYLHKAVDLDTVKKNKIEYASTAVTIMQKAEKLRPLIDWVKIKSDLIGDTKLSEYNFYVIGTAAIDAIDTSKDSTTIMQQYLLADSIAKAYIAAYPDKSQGYNSEVIAAKKADKDTTWGLALGPIATADKFFEADTSARSKKLLFLNGYYELLYFLRYAKDAPRIEEYKRAVQLIDELLPYFTDPNSEENKYFTQTRAAIQASIDKYEKGKQQSSSGTKPSGGKQK
ncbi:MAG TPA: hypothetical protein VG738_11160 [Chitinophagaceae bacterium]|nr:hypothetical protein [Chitinophagaceae bacterium]